LHYQAHPHPHLHPTHHGKAERFIQTAIREWAYARLYQNSAIACPSRSWIHQYNCIDLTPPSIKPPITGQDSMSTTS